MSLKKSEEYYYFQNKASHYNNIINIKSRLDTKPPLTLRKTIDYHDIKNAKKHLPHLREFQINFQNQKMMDRILNQNKSPINKHYTYARYNKFQRKFRQNNPYKTQEERLIQLQNQKLKKSISMAKAEVGTIDTWKKIYNQNIKHSRLISRYEGNHQKGDLTIQTQKFLPQSYLKYLQQMQKSANQYPQDVNKKKILKLQKQQLFVLPSLNSSPKVLNSQDSKSSLSRLNNSQLKNPEQKQ